MHFVAKNKFKLPDLVYDVRYHPVNHNLIAAATISGSIHLLESAKQKSVLRKLHKGSPIRRVRFNSNGHMVTIAKTVKIHDLESNQTIHMLKRAEALKTPFYSLKPFGSHIISAGDDDGRLMVWDIRTSICEPLFTAQDCDQYISDIDGEERKLLVCTSGEGTLTAYDMRQRKMIEPQSELFEAGFQCLKMGSTQVYVGGEDGSFYVFNRNEWAHTKEKFSMSNDTRHQGKNSIDCMDILQENGVILAGCSDGRLRAASLMQRRVLCEQIFCKKSPIEAIHIHPNPDAEQKIVICGENFIEIAEYQGLDDDASQDGECEQNDDADDDDDDDDDDEDSDEEMNEKEDNKAGGNGRGKNETNDNKDDKESMKEDYLGIF